MIPPDLRNQLGQDPNMTRCIHTGRPTGKDCSGRITFEHALTYAGRQVNEPWAIVPCCVFHHLGAGLDKEFNRHAALQRATDADLAKYPRAGWEQMKRYLARKFSTPCA